MRTMKRFASPKLIPKNAKHLPAILTGKRCSWLTLFGGFRRWRWRQVFAEYRFVPHLDWRRNQQTLTATGTRNFLPCSFIRSFEILSTSWASESDHGPELKIKKTAIDGMGNYPCAEGDVGKRKVELLELGSVQQHG